jgi:hypothetical protein
LEKSHQRPEWLLASLPSQNNLADVNHEVKINFIQRVSMRFLPVLCVGLLFMFTGCAADVANQYYAAERYPAKPTKEVEVLYKNPTRPYEVIADLQARNAGAASMRRQAAKIGADAVIVSFLGGCYNTHSEWADAKNFANDTYSRVTGTAIRYK